MQALENITKSTALESIFGSKVPAWSEPWRPTIWQKIYTGGRPLPKLLPASLFENLMKLSKGVCYPLLSGNMDWLCNSISLKGENYYEPCMHTEMTYSRKLDHQQFRRKCQNSLSQVLWKSADKPKPGKDQHLVKIKTARPETSYGVLPTRTTTVNWIKCYGCMTVFWGILINITYVGVRHVRKAFNLPQVLNGSHHHAFKEEPESSSAQY